jgi:hypothetical protein
MEKCKCLCELKDNKRGFAHASGCPCFYDDRVQEKTCPECGYSSTRGLTHYIKCSLRNERPENWQEKHIVEITERIVVDYANLSGRESANRTEFRERVRVHIKQLLLSKAELIEGHRKEYSKPTEVWGENHEITRGFNAGLDKAIEIIKQ